MAEQNNGGESTQQTPVTQNQGATKKDGVTAGDIRAAIDGVTGAPTSGVVADVTPALVKAIDELVNGKPEAVEQRVVKPAETRKADATTKQ
jgi:hypothetical protein